MFLTTSLSPTSLNLFKSTRTIFNLAASKLSSFPFKLFKLVGMLTSLLMSSFPTSALKQVKSFLTAKSGVSTPVAESNLYLVVFD